MAPTDPDEAKAEQLRLAKELQRDFQKSGSFKGNPSGQGQGRARSRPCKSSNNQPVSRPTYDNQYTPRSSSLHTARPQGYDPSSIQPRNPNLGRSGFSINQAPGYDTRKRKMDAQAADFFADRRNTPRERGAVQYYQGQNRATAHSPPTGRSDLANTSHQDTMYHAPAMAANAAQPARVNVTSQLPFTDTSAPGQQRMASTQPLQPTVRQNANMGPVNITPVNTNTTLSGQVPIAGPIIWHYQDNSAQPQPLVRDENTMDIDRLESGAPGVLSERQNNQLTVCTCTRVPPPPGTSGLISSVWSQDNMKVDDNCPYHGIVSSYRHSDSRNGGNDGGGNAYNGYAQSTSENRPRYVGYYQ